MANQQVAMRVIEKANIEEEYSFFLMQVPLWWETVLWGISVVAGSARRSHPLLRQIWYFGAHLFLICLAPAPVPLCRGARVRNTTPRNREAATSKKTTIIYNMVLCWDWHRRIAYLGTKKSDLLILSTYVFFLERADTQGCAEWVCWHQRRSPPAAPAPHIKHNIIIIFYSFILY